MMHDDDDDDDDDLENWWWVWWAWEAVYPADQLREPVPAEPEQGEGTTPSRHNLTIQCCTEYYRLVQVTLFNLRGNETIWYNIKYT